MKMLPPITGLQLFLRYSQVESSPLAWPIFEPRISGFEFDLFTIEPNIKCLVKSGETDLKAISIE